MRVQLPCMSEPRSSLLAAKLIALCTLASRITGMLRDMLLLHAFGQSWIADAFNFGFQFPNLFRRLFGEGALAAVFVPQFTRALETDGRPAAWQLLARTLALLTIVLTGVVVLGELVLLGVWMFGAAGADDDSQARRLLLAMTGLMLPFMLSICVLALFSSVLNCLGNFVPGALASIVLNLGMIGGILWLGPLVGGTDPARQVYGVAISVLISGVVQILVVLPALRRTGVPVGWSFQPRDPGVRRILALMGPVLLGQGALLLSTFLDSVICTILTRRYNWLGEGFPYPLAEGSFTAITTAARLYQFPLGVLVISLATAALPAFSRMAVKKDWLGWTGEVRFMLRMAVFEGLLAGAMMIVLAEPIIRLLFEYRNFNAADTSRAAHVLAWYGVGMWAFCAQHIVQRGFFSIGDVRTPLRITLLTIPVNLAVSLSLIWFEGVREAAFAIASSVSSSFGVVLGLVYLRRRVDAPLFTRDLLGGLVRMLAAAAASAGVVLAVRGWSGEGLAGLPVGIIGRRALDALGFLAAGTVVYMLIATLIGLGEARLLLRLRKPTRASG